MADKPDRQTTENPDPTPTAPPVAGLGDGAPIDPRSEKPIWDGRTDWKHYTPLVIFGVIVLVVAEIALGLVAGSAGLSTGWAILVGAMTALLVATVITSIVGYRILSTRYELTSQRLFIIRGIFSQIRDQNEIIRVDDVRLHQTLIDRFFGLGTVEVMSTDATDRTAMIVGIADAKAVAEHIRAQMRILRSRSLFVENL